MFPASGTSILLYSGCITTTHHPTEHFLTSLLHLMHHTLQASSDLLSMASSGQLDPGEISQLDENNQAVSKSKFSLRIKLKANLVVEQVMEWESAMHRGQWLQLQ